MNGFKRMGPLEEKKRDGLAHGGLLPSQQAQRADKLSTLTEKDGSWGAA